MVFFSRVGEKTYNFFPKFQEIMIFSRISNIKSCELNHYVILFLDLPVHDPIMYVLKLRCYDRKDSLSFPLRSMLNTMNNAYHKDVSIFY